MEHARKKRPGLAVIGGGLAGIAAAEHAIRQGFNVDLFEWSRVLGGRAASLFEPHAGRWIDNGQHVVLGCNTELAAMNERLGLSGEFEQSDSITFTARNDRQWVLSSSPYMPLRWQMAPSFLKVPFLTFRERLTTGLMLRKLTRLGNRRIREDKNMTLGEWLRKEGASDEAIERFWAPLVFRGLSETVEFASLYAVGKIVKDSFFSGRDAMSLHVPKKPLREIYHHRTGAGLEKLGIRVHYGSRLERIETDGKNRTTAIVLNGGRTVPFDNIVFAIPAHRVWKILNNSGLGEFADTLDFGRYEPGAITTVHLWMKRRILPEGLSQAALLGSPAQWISCPENGFSAPNASIHGVYHLLTIGASHRILSENELIAHGNTSLRDRIMEQLRALFPETLREQPEPLHTRVTTVFEAVFSPSPAVYENRPPHLSPLENLALAGDWTQTGWPSCMEGAVRSGQQAVESLK